MSSGSTGRGPELSAADHRIVRYLADTNVEYPALIASHTGLHVPLVERRCRLLVGAGLLEPVSGEVLYRLTDRGRSLARRLRR